MAATFHHCPATSNVFDNPVIFKFLLLSKYSVPKDVSCVTVSPTPLKCLTRPSFSLIGPEV